MGYLLSNPHPLPAPSATRAVAASRGTKTAKKDVDRGINHCILVYYSTSYIPVCQGVVLHEKQQLLHREKQLCRKFP